MSLSRHKGSRDRKQSQYEFDAAREELQLPTANAQQIANPNPTPKSPTKREYKEMLLEEKSKNEVLFAEVEERKHADEANPRKILSLKDTSGFQMLQTKIDQYKNFTCMLEGRQASDNKRFGKT
jgi:hypothetical protein